MVAAYALEPSLAIEQIGVDPALDHRSFSPSLDVSRVALERDVGISDRVGRPNCSPQCAGRAEANAAAGRHDPFAHRSGGTGTPALRRPRRIVSRNGVNRFGIDARGRPGLNCLNRSGRCSSPKDRRGELAVDDAFPKTEPGPLMTTKSNPLVCSHPAKSCGPVDDRHFHRNTFCGPLRTRPDANALRCECAVRGMSPAQRQEPETRATKAGQQAIFLPGVGFNSYGYVGSLRWSLVQWLQLASHYKPSEGDVASFRPISTGYGLHEQFSYTIESAQKGQTTNDAHMTRMWSTIALMDLFCIAAVPKLPRQHAMKHNRMCQLSIFTALSHS